MNIYETHSRDELIELAHEFARVARRAFDEHPDQVHYIRINGDVASGKSLFVDVIKADLFGESTVPAPQDRVIRHYSGAIGENQGVVSLVNVWTDSCGVSLLAGKMQRKGAAGFIFVLNEPRFRLYRRQQSLMEINVTFPDTVKQSFSYRVLRRGIEKQQPKTWDRVVTCAMAAGSR